MPLSMKVIFIFIPSIIATVLIAQVIKTPELGNIMSYLIGFVVGMIANFWIMMRVYHQ